YSYMSAFTFTTIFLHLSPCLAHMLQPVLTQTSPRAYMCNLAAAIIAPIVCVVAVVIIDQFATDEMPVDLFLAMRPWLALTLAALLVGTGLALYWRRKGPTLKPVLATAIAGMIAWQSVALGYDELSPATSSYHMVQRIVA